MEQDQEYKHVCKFCKKKFPCGRSLGGHMRSHMLNSSSEANKDKKSTTTSSVFNGTSDFEASGAGGYGLRENPKKTWRFSDSFGHMRSEHSVFEKEHGNSWIDENQELVLDSQSDNEAVAPKRKRRSRRMRYNTTTTAAAAAANINTNVTATATATVTTSSSFSFANGSTTCVSEIEQEQEEVAMCLMMLSRDVGYWGGLNSVVESSDNNSVVFEVSDRKFKSLVFESQSVRFHKRRSEFERNGFKKIESDEYIGDENKLNEVDSECGKYNSKKKRCDALDYEMRNDDSRTKAKYKCTTCNRTFRSYQALGGHRASHKKEKGYLASKIETSENSIETDTTTPELIPDSYIERVVVSSTSSPPLKKTKHECPICFKVFASGQALGGHKRSHTIEVSEARSNETIVMQQQQPRQLPQVRDLLDLNLPAPVEEDNTTNSCIPFKPWWMETSHTHEPPAVGVITN